MAEQSHGVRRSEKVRGKDVEGKIRVLDKTYPQQLTLFQTFFPDYVTGLEATILVFRQFKLLRTDLADVT